MANYISFVVKANNARQRDELKIGYDQTVIMFHYLRFTEQ